MSIYELFHDYLLDGGIVAVSIMTLIQIAPIQINPWSRIASAIGKVLNKELEQEIARLNNTIEETRKNVTSLTEQVHEMFAVAARARILRFGDEVSHHQSHSRDHFKQIFLDITNYDNYCDAHPHFKNNLTDITVERIKEDYKQRDEKTDFL